MRRVLVTGPRDYDDSGFVWSKLDALHSEQPIVCIIHGAATGVDSHASTWARRHGVEEAAFPADWSRIDGPATRIKVNRCGRAYNALAGFARNAEMLRLSCPTHVAVFTHSGPDPPGTSDMIAKARRAQTGGSQLEILIFRK